MSAEKCGSPCGIVLVSPTVTQEEIPTSVSISSKRSTDMLKRVQAKLPYFFPSDEREIWTRARSLGLVEEE